MSLTIGLGITPTTRVITAHTAMTMVVLIGAAATVGP